MTRNIYCPKCAPRFSALHPEDVAVGFKLRVVEMPAVKKPEEHGFTITSAEGSQYESLSSIRCDACNADIADGSPAVGVTMWRPSREPEPRNWEGEYQ